MGIRSMTRQELFDYIFDEYSVEPDFPSPFCWTDQRSGRIDRDPYQGECQFIFLVQFLHGTILRLFDQAKDITAEQQKATNRQVKCIFCG